MGGVLGYKHITEHALDRLHRDTASQAERAGFWHWAVFVLQHIEDGGRRREAIEAVLDRNIAHCDQEKERFLVNDLGIPLKWVARAKATLARAQGRPRDRAENLLVAERWVEAHEVIVKDIAPDCIIGQEYQYLSSLLTQLAPPHIAKKVAHLMRAVHTMVGTTSDNTARQLAENLSTLPLPEDYALQELRSLTRSYMMEIA